MWIQDRFFKYALAVIMILTIILLMYYAAPIFLPILWFITAILLPILFSTLLYYILRPVVAVLERWGLPRYAAIIVVYIGIVLVSALATFTAVPKIMEQIALIGDIPPEKIEALKTNTKSMIGLVQKYISIAKTPAIEDALITYVQKINPILYKFAYNTISTLASIAIALVLTPFVLFYFLRDDELFAAAILRYIPASYRNEVESTLKDVDETLSGFILGQMTIALVVGVFLFFGYTLIGLHEALSLAFLAMLFYVVPILGTFIALVPAFIVGLSVNLSMALKVVAVMYVAHLIEGNFLTPRIMSQRLKIHPLTIILLLLAAGSLYGLIGLILVTPTYAIAKVIIWNLYKVTHLERIKNES